MRWLILLLFTYVCYACNSTETLIAESFDACLEIPQCMDAFYLTPSCPSWERRRFNLLMGILLNKLSPLNYTTICNCTEAFDVWVVLMSNWDFCAKNEIWSETSDDCTCRRDKNCDPKMNGTLGYSLMVEYGIAILFMIAFLYYAPYTLKELSRLTMLVGKSKTPKETELQRIVHLKINH